MYLAQINLQSEVWLQGAIQFTNVPPDKGASNNRLWWRTLDQVIRSSELLPRSLLTTRFLSTKSGSVERLMFLAAPRQHEWELRRQIGLFTRLSTIVDDSVAMPVDERQYEILKNRFPGYRCPIRMPAYSAANVWFACNFHLAPSLEELFAAGDALGLAIGYEVRVENFAPDAELLRAVAKNALRIRTIAGVPLSLVQLQTKLAEELTSASARFIETVAVESLEGVDWTDRWLKRLFLEQFGPLKFDPPNFQFSKEMSSGPSASAMFDLSVDETCASAVDSDQRTKLLAWRTPDGFSSKPEKEIVPRLPAATIECIDLKREIVPSSFPKPYEGNDEFIFLSYKRGDFDRVMPIVETLVETGQRVWFDKEIPGGSEWDALIEEKIERCLAVLLCISTASIESRYVRREVKFADTLRKPIIGVRVENAELGHGMKMLLNQYQTLDANSADLAEQLRKALTYVRLV
jgi:hypothetical protein